MEVMEGYKQTEVGVIPDDWSVLSLREVTNIKTGPFGSSLHERDYVSDGTPIITVEHLSEYGVVHSNLPMVSETDKQRLKSYVLEENDIVFSRVGSVDRNSLINQREAGWLFSGRLLRVRPNIKKVFSQFLSYQFNSEPFKQRVRSVAVGQTMASLNTQILNGIIIYLPPLPEQRAIATTLSDVDALITSLDQFIAKKRNIKQAAMQELLNGKRRLLGFEERWEEKRLGDIGSFSKGKGLAKNDLNSSGDLPAIPYTAIYTYLSEVVNISMIHDFTSLDNANEKKVINSPHLLIACSSNMLENVGKASAFIDNINIAIGGDIILYKTNIDVRFLSYLMSSHSHRKTVVFLSQGSTIRHVYVSTFRNYEVILPSVSEQHAIATVLSDMDAELAALEQKRDKTKAIKQGMMQELLTGRIRLV